LPSSLGQSTVYAPQLPDGPRITKLHTAVHDSIHTVGGYWPPLAATARLLEEVGEVNELFQKRINGPQLDAELADLMVISTCLANQYCIRLADWNIAYESPEVATSFVYKSAALTAAWISQLAIYAGQVARTVNMYEGIKQPREASGTPHPLGRWIALLHGHIIGIANARGIDIWSTVEQVIAAKSRRDADRFSRSYDPTMAHSLEAFRKIQAATVCPYAPTAKLWGAPDWEADQTTEANLSKILPPLQRFAFVQRWEPLDGFVLELTNHGDFSDLEAMASTLNGVLRWLNDNDARGTPVFGPNVRAKDWQFTFAGVRLFVLVFAPFYGRHHPRESYCLQSAFILFQCEDSFHRAHDPGTPIDHIEIRRRFAAAGKDYDCYIMHQPYEAPRYLKPLYPGDPEVAWWRLSDPGR